MKKRHIIQCSLATATAIAGVIAVSMLCAKLVNAEKSNLSGKGNFIFKSGEMEAAFYAEDVNYLQEEITELFHELEEDENE